MIIPKNNNLHFIKSILPLIIYRILLDICYSNYISPIYEYTGFYNNKTASSYFLSWLFLCPFLFFLPILYKKKNISSAVVILFALGSIIPTSSLFAFMPPKNNFFILSFLYWFFLFIFFFTIPTIKIPRLNFKPKTFIIIIQIIFILTVLYVSYKFTHFRFHFNLYDVYDLRFEARNYNIPTIFNYILSASGTILPLFFIWHIMRKKKKQAIIIGIVILLNFGIAGHKSIVFKLLLAILGYYFFQFKIIKYFGWGFALLSAIALLESTFIKTFNFISLIINRVIFSPSLLNYFYYDFFSSHEKDYFRQGFLKYFGFQSSYNTPIDFIIGEQYFGNDLIRANNGLFSDAYMNLGVFGVFFQPIILIVILKLIDSFSKGIDERLLFIVIVGCYTALISTTFSTALLTSGLLLSMLVLYLFRSQMNCPAASSGVSST